MINPVTHKLNLLIVDDDAVDRMALQRALKGTTFDVTVTEATDVRTALEAISHGKYDCIFLDYNLPGESGLDLTRKVRAQGLKVPLIVLTGQGDEQTAVELMKAGASDYLPKNKLSSESIARLIRSTMRVFKAEAAVDKVNQNLRDKNNLLEKKNQESEQQRQHIYKQNLQLQEVSRLKSEFLATMSHELRTPLNAIIGFSQILLSKTKDLLDDPQQNMISRILANGRNLLELIDDILAFSKLEAGRLDLDPVEMDLSALVMKTTEELRSLADQKSLHLLVDIDLSNPIIVNDSVRLRQVLVNLLSNSIKFTETGSVHVQVKELSCIYGELSQNNQSEADSLAIGLSVIDTGCGISADNQLHIFDPFHQADQRVTRKHAGAGLGLAITHSLVKMMHGDITVNSRENEGTTFTIKIPRTVVVRQNDPTLGELARSEQP
ncbi:MAG: ATP-binding protein [Cyanobacteria bacterium J06581_3]